MTRAWELRARASPRALDASSTVPNASIRTSSLGTRPPPSNPVVPSSPVPESSSIGLRREEPFLAEDLAEPVQLLRHAPGFLDHLGQGYDLDIAVAADGADAAPAFDDQLDSGDPQARRPDPVDG